MRTSTTPPSPIARRTSSCWWSGVSAAGPDAAAGRRARGVRTVRVRGSSPSSKNDRGTLLAGKASREHRTAIGWRAALQLRRHGRDSSPRHRTSHPVYSADSMLATLVLDRYRLVRRLGAGGFGTVWLAEDERLGREVAVKRVLIGDGDEAERARREAQVVARLSHPGIVALYEAGADDAACYLVSELVRGETLGVLEAEGALSDLDVVEIGIALCEALAHAHARGVVHRDVKPGNVIVPEARGDGEPHAKLTDFGIARAVGDDALTRTGDVLGTLAYMAPEHAEGRGATERSDLYALALVLYEALAGVNPVRGATPAETARRIGDPLPALGRYRRDLPRALTQALDDAVAVEPEDRGTLNDLRTALARSRDAVSDEPGVVGEVGGVTALTQQVFGGRASEAVPPTQRAWPELDEPRGRGFGRAVPADERYEWAWDEGEVDAYDARAARRRGAWDAAVDDVPLRRARTGWRARLAAGLAAGLLAAAALAGLAPSPPPVAPLAALGGVALAVALLPRLAWLAAAVGLLAWLALAGRPGTAVVLAPALVLVPILLPRARATWSLPATAPVLGLAGLSPAACAIAGQASTLPRRAALGALSAVWLVLAEALLDRRLLAGVPEGVPPLGVWERDAEAAVTDVLANVLDVRALALAATFALAAAVLPWLVRGRNVVPDAVAATAWAAGLAAATQAAVAPAEARGLVVGAIVAGALAVVLRAAHPLAPGG